MIERKRQKGKHEHTDKETSRQTVKQIHKEIEKTRVRKSTFKIERHYDIQENCYLNNTQKCNKIVFTITTRFSVSDHTFDVEAKI